MNLCEEVADPCQHQAGKGDEVQTGQGFRQSLVVSGEPTKASRPGKKAFCDPSAREQDKTLSGLRSLDHLETNAVSERFRSRRVPRIALIDKGPFDLVVGHRLDLLGQSRDVGAILFVGRRDPQGQKMAQGIDRGMDFGAFPALGPVIPGPLSAFGSGLKSATVQNDRCRIGSPPLTQTEQSAQIIDHGLEAARRQPALGLLMDRRPRREIMRSKTPGRTGSNHPA